MLHLAIIIEVCYYSLKVVIDQYGFTEDDPKIEDDNYLHPKTEDRIPKICSIHDNLTNEE